eukprot:3820145-Alexandrium_andersonii.AAC.1
MPERLLTGHAVLSGAASCKGARYLAVDGGRVPNFGEVDSASSPRSSAAARSSVRSQRRSGHCWRSPP